jgi:hypothetical protein
MKGGGCNGFVEKLSTFFRQDHKIGFQVWLDQNLRGSQGKVKMQSYSSALLNLFPTPLQSFTVLCFHL